MGVNEAFHLAELRYTTVELTFRCTDSSMIEWLIEQIQEAELNARHEVISNPSEQPFQVTLTKLGDRDVGWAWWVLGLLCAIGWEPFSAYDTGGPSAGQHIFLKFDNR